MDNMFLCFDRVSFDKLVNFLPQVISSIIVIILMSVLRLLVQKVITTYVKTHSNSELRLHHMNRINRISFNALVVIILVVIWGVDTENIFLTLSSVFAVIGIAFFAQWSLLSNITAGIILFFSSAYRIGNTIRIIDTEMPIEARIEDILTFHTYLRTKEGELHIIPNSLLMQKAIHIKKMKSATPQNPQQSLK
jgi:MscS family membrane protein